LIHPPPPNPTPFPYTTLFRSREISTHRMAAEEPAPESVRIGGTAHARRGVYLALRGRRQRAADVGRHGAHADDEGLRAAADAARDRKSTRLNSSHSQISYAVF